MDRNTPTRWARQGQTCIYCGKQEFCGSTYLSQNKMCRLYRGALGYWLHIGPYQKLDLPQHSWYGLCITSNGYGTNINAFEEKSHVPRNFERVCTHAACGRG